jgi:hypothetical protein
MTELTTRDGVFGYQERGLMPFSPSDLVLHDIYAKNLVMGGCLFFGLMLPPNWQLAPGVGRPEINSTLRREEEKAWVADGRAWYVLHDPERRWALEAAISISSQRPKTKADTEKVIVGGHPANLTWSKRRRGLPWRRHDVVFMKLDFYCPETERRIKVEFSGWCPQEGFQEILQAARFLRCH